MSHLTSLGTNVVFSGNITSSGTGGFSCPTHGFNPCNCFNYGGIYPATHSTNHVQCGSCQQWYDPTSIHFCSANLNVLPNTWARGTTTTLGTWNTGPTFKELKEITTDIELIYELSDSFVGYSLKLPLKFTDCFLKVGSSWVPLYPVIFSAHENDEKELSFHIITSISEKAFEGNKVVLKSVHTRKIEDNLTLVQLYQRVNDYFKDK